MAPSHSHPYLAYLGATRQSRKNFKWNDGTTMEYKSWDENEPNNVNDADNCVASERKGDHMVWDDVNCNSTVTFVVCERCAEGTYGPHCDITCSGCINSCARKDGTCKPCKIGYYGSKCEQCSLGCRKRICNQTSGVCNDGCIDGYHGDMCRPCEGSWGRRCSNDCHCYRGHLCDPRNGSCRFGCAVHWSGPSCEVDSKCGVNHWGNVCLQCGQCAVYGCDVVTGECPTNSCRHNFIGHRCDMCPPNVYGRMCEHRCGACTGRCDTVTGLCDGGCSDGYMGARCDVQCAAGLWGHICSPECSMNCRSVAVCSGVDGSCDVTCSHRNDRCEAMCSPVDGRCSLGCNDGWTGPNCDRVMTCNDTTMYGRDCDIPCGHCATGGDCMRESGMCTTGCSNGYRGPRCVDECPSGYHGVGCEQVCGRCAGGQTCDVIRGTCTGGCMGEFGPQLTCTICTPGFHGPECDSPCGHCRGGEDCDTYSGACPHGCALNFRGNFCGIRITDVHIPYL